MRTIAQLIASENRAEGPFLRSGGVVHLLDANQRDVVAMAIAKASQVHKVPVPILCAFIRGEGNFDPAAEDPNRQNYPLKPGVSPIANTDYGIAQVNGRPDLGGWAGLYDSLEYLCNEIIQNVLWAAGKGYPVEVGYDAYNHGRSGAEQRYKTGIIKLMLNDYGRLVASRVKQYQDVI
jgi:hypothetical protein